MDDNTLVILANQRDAPAFSISLERKPDSGVFLSVLGFGRGNYNDALMQVLAQNGNGNAAYIDNLFEVRKVLVDEASLRCVYSSFTALQHADQ